MKRIALLFLFIALATGAVMGQSIDVQLAVTTQSLTQAMLEDLNLSDAEIRNILQLQEQFRLLKEQNALELNVIKAQLAQMLYNADTNDAEVNLLLEKAGELRLEQEKAQVQTYQNIRKEMGEECWSDLMKQIRTRSQTRQQTQTNTRTPGNGSSNSSGSFSGSGSSAGGSQPPQSRGSSNR